MTEPETDATNAEAGEPLPAADADELVPLLPHEEESLSAAAEGAAPALDPEASLDPLRTGLTAAAILGVGVLVAVAFVASRPDAPRRPAKTAKTGVRVFELTEREVRPKVEGFGRARSWRGVVVSAQVGGVVTEVHPDLEDGKILAAGDAALRIDPSNYEAALQRETAQVEAARAEVERLEAQIASVESRLVLAVRLNDVEQAELLRAQDLYAKEVRNDRELEVARLAAIRAEDALLGVRETRATLGPMLRAARARVVEAEARMALAALDLERTVVRAPFLGQLAGVSVEAHQLVTQGAVLFGISDPHRLEVPVALGLEDARLIAGDLERVPKGRPDEAEKVVVEYEGAGEVLRWTGVMRRFEPVDARTQTVNAVVLVENEPGKVPLVPNVFCRVLLQAASSHRGLLLPVDALQERDQVYVVRDGKLAIVEPELGRRLGGWVRVEGGLEPGEQVIVSPLERVVEGIALEVVGVER
jgi:RND family efflux transporter MFP subunit